MLFFKYLLILSLLLLATSSHGKPARGHNITSTELYEFPFVVSLSNANDIFEPEYNHYCTGTLISKKHVLTAAHCVDGHEYHAVRVLVGSADLARAKIHNVLSWITYNDWFSKTMNRSHPEQNDIAIVMLKEAKHAAIVPANLPYTVNDLLYGHTVTAVGWGDTGHIHPLRISQKVPLQVIPNAQCSLEIQSLTNKPKNVFVTNKYLCTKAEPWALIDEGDSGGPVLNENNEIVGVNKGTIPHFEGLGLPKDYIDQNQYNLHMSVYYYRKFIQAVLTDSFLIPEYYTYSVGQT